MKKGAKHRHQALVGLSTAGWLALSTVQAAVTKGPVSDEIEVELIPNGAPIKLDGYGVLSGPDAALGSALQFTNSDPKSFKIGVNPKKTWPRTQ